MHTYTLTWVVKYADGRVEPRRAVLHDPEEARTREVYLKYGPGHPEDETYLDVECKRTKVN